MTYPVLDKFAVEFVCIKFEGHIHMYYMYVLMIDIMGCLWLDMCEDIAEAQLAESFSKASTDFSEDLLKFHFIS